MMRKASFTGRLAGFFSAFFLLFMIILFAISYSLLSTALRSEEYRALQDRTLRFWALYQNHGLELLTEEGFRNGFLREGELSLVRFARGTGETLLFYVPDHWGGLTQQQFDRLAAAEPGAELLLRLPEAGEVLNVISVRLGDDYLLQIGVPAGARIELLARFRGHFLLLALPLLGASIAGGILFSRRAVRPIRDLTRVIGRITATGRMEERIPPSGTGDDLEALVIQFNSMIERIDALVRGMRQALDSAAHDLRTPLTRLSARAEMSLRSGDSAAREEALRLNMDEARRMIAMLETLMDISEAETGILRLRLEDVDLSDITADVAELFRYGAEDAGISMELRLQDHLPVRVDLDRFRQLLANLLDNAVKYTPRGGSILIETGRKGEKAVISISDTGIGIAPEDLPRIWERLFRADRSRGEPGYGLGLSLVKAVAEAHRGEVRAESTPGSGSRFSVILNMTEL